MPLTSWSRSVVLRLDGKQRTRVAKDALFSHIETLQGDTPWGRFLDAGTGEHSLRWITTLKTLSWLAVTASKARMKNLRRDFLRFLEAEREVVVGQWSDPYFLAGKTYDVVLADYLLGAIDAASPYYQDQLFKRLKPHVNGLGGRLYVVGMQPVPVRGSDEASSIVAEVNRVRDACILLAGHRPNREYPLAWVETSLKAAGFAIVSSKRFGNRYRANWVERQLNVCRQKFRYFASQPLRDSMAAYVDELQARGQALANKIDGLAAGFDYVVMAVPQAETPNAS